MVLNINAVNGMRLEAVGRPDAGHHEHALLSHVPHGPAHALSAQPALLDTSIGLRTQSLESQAISFD
jgi:hypothetical protein